jgi:hypothetical protein
MDLIDRYFSGPTFWESVRAGFVVMLVQVGVLGAAFDYYERRKWRGTRQGLAHVLLDGMNELSESCSSVLERHDSRMMLNNETEVHLLKFKTVIGNLYEKTIVHLPALLPRLSVELSHLIGLITFLEQRVTDLQYYHGKIKSAINNYHPNNLDKRDPILKDPADIEIGKDGHKQLRGTAERSYSNYFFATIMEIFRATSDLSVAIDGIAQRYGENWARLYTLPQDRARNSVVEQKFRRMQLV